MGLSMICKFCNQLMRAFHQSEMSSYKHWYCDNSKCHSHCTQEFEQPKWYTESEWDSYINDHDYRSHTYDV
jgi:hypothetical protein